MTNKEKFNQIFEKTFGVSAYDVFELECTFEGRCPHYDEQDFKCKECEYDSRNFWNQEYKKKDGE